MASSRGQPDCWKPYASYLGKVKLNLDCWIFYREGYVNIDRNREVRADRYEDGTSSFFWSPRSSAFTSCGDGDDS